MRARQAVALAWRSISSHAGRSALTVLGVLISVAMVVALVTLGAGVQASLAGDIASDASTINVWAGPEEGARHPGGGAQPVFTDQDVSRIEDLAGVKRVGTRGYARVGAIAINGSLVRDQQVVAVNAEYFSADEFDRGRPFQSGRREVVLNPAAADRFENNVSVGDSVTLARPDGNESATVVGVLADSQAKDPFDGLGEKPRVYVPTDPFYGSTASDADGERAYPILFVVADSPDVTETVSERVRTYLQTNSDAAGRLPADYQFSLRTNDEFLSALLGILETIAAFILGIAVISLVIGGIGIANTMLVSVLERTTEIGIMKTVGAHRREVLAVFFAESVLLSTLGSVLGVVVGMMTGYVGSVTIEVPFVIPWQWVGVALVVGITIGGLAGLYPAWRAATTEPVEALSAE